MTDLIIKEPLASEIRALAEREQRTPEEVLADIVQTRRKSPPPPEYPVYEPRPAWSLTDADIDVPEDIVAEKDREAYRQAAREIAPKIYEIAREYWTEVGNAEKLALTDEQLDKLFWFIDHDGIPRFKSEKGTIVRLPDPMEALIGLIDTDETNLSTTVGESVAEYFKKRYGSLD